MEHSFEAGAPIFEVRDLCYDYDGQIAALEGINLTVQAGESVAILGSNGSGKSTLLKILDGLYFPSRGTVEAFGHPLSEQALRDDAFNFAFRSRVGFVFQDSDAQLFMPSVWEEIAFAPLQLGIPPEEVTARIDAALAALHLEKLRDRPPHQLSGGEKKKVSLASILSLAPQVWLLDEPSAGLDPRSVSWLIDFITRQAGDGKTIVLATHDLEIVEAISEQVYVLDEDHHLVAAGTPGEILKDTSLLVQANLARHK
ncbi:MAG: ABC transporter ATP-binding protein [Chloroflexi bacterium]|nr:ABC transporter ATP-binding protein [Anaerolineaceae bacterium]NMB87768.1 ABC transporter ATP-binding protein [Chloroflexota bacterium]